MARKDALSGVRKWLDREEWQDAYDDFFELHLGQPCATAGISPDELPDIVGDAAMGVLFGCIFEDMLAADLEDGGNVIDDYLKRRGWKESVPNKRYMMGLRASVMSLHEVSDIVLDQSFLARDLLRGGEPMRISEKIGTRSLKPWDLLAARVVKVGSKAEMAGGALPLRREVGEAIRNGFIELRQGMHAEIGEMIRQRQGDIELDPYVLDTEVLRRSAFLFTHAWLDDALRYKLDPRRPTLVNSDGDTIALTTVRFPLKPGVDRKAIEEGLSAIPGFQRADDGRWDWVGPNTGSLPGDSVSMGDVELEADTLKVETNSPQRAEKARAVLDPVIRPFVGEPIVATTTVEEMMATRPAKGEPPPSSGLSPDEESAIVREALEHHYRKVLDEAVPMLGNVSPREAAKTKKGREKLVGWLKLLENSTAGQKADSPMASYDVSWMWDELGVADLRR